MQSPRAPSAVGSESVEGAKDILSEPNWPPAQGSLSPHNLGVQDQPNSEAAPKTDSTSADVGFKRKRSCSSADGGADDETFSMEDAACSSGADEINADANLSGDHIESSGRSRPAIPITLELLSQGGYYDMPMSKVARLLGRTEGSFQRVCRGLGILRWPYRVRKSLQAIMEKTEQYLDDDAQEDGLSKAEVLKVLRRHMDDIKGISGSGMDKATKQYRQYIFKVNHKLSRKAARGGDAASAENLKVRGMLRAASKIQKPTRTDAEGDELGASGELPLSQGDNKRQARGCGVKHRGVEPLSPRHAIQPLVVPELSPSRHSSGRQSMASAEGAGSERCQPEDDGSKGSQKPRKTLIPTRPHPRHFRDLPVSLAFEPLGMEKAAPSNIMGRMATSAAVQNRLKPESPADCRRLCMQEDQELLKLCLELDAHLDAAQKMLAAKPALLPKLDPMTDPYLLYQQLNGPSGGFGMPTLPLAPQLFLPPTQQIAFWPH